MDIWAIGCILGELIVGEPLFPANSEIELAEMMFELLGTPEG